MHTWNRKEKGGCRQGNTIRNVGRRVNADRELTVNWRKKDGCRQGSKLGTGGRRLKADREAYLELEEEQFD